MNTGFLLSLVFASMDETSLQKEADAWHQKRVERLLAEDGWLSLVGLFWVTSTHTFGSATDADFRLPDTTPAKVGVFAKAAKGVSFVPASGVPVTLEGKPFTGGILSSDEKGKPDILRLGSLQFFVIQRGSRLGVRVKDAEAFERRHFSGISRYNVRSRFVVEASYTSFPTPKTLQVPTVLGTTEPMNAPGLLTFFLGGKKFQLLPVVEKGGDEMFVIFSDLTSRKDTYPAGRFLYAPLPKDGKVTLDFNRAFNPPCAFTRFATCPLPPKENRLKVFIEAGEKRYTKAAH